MDKPSRAWFWFVVMLFSLFGFVGVVFAAGTPADPNTNPHDALQQLWDAVAARRWGLAAVIGTMCFVALMRFVAPKIHGKFGAWIQSSRVSAALAFLGGMFSALAVKLMSGSPWSMNIVVFGFNAGFGAIGGYNAFWDLLFPADKKPTVPPGGVK